MCFDDERVTCFNDSATNIAAAPAEIIIYAERLGFYNKDVPIENGVKFKHLSDSGYISITRGELKLVLDVASLGPDYLLAHAHADTLSFELSVNTQRIIVNSGTSCYGKGARRGFERSTRAHNTVEIDSCSSSEVWSAFRVARRARPFGLIIDNSEERLSVECSHDGYTRLPGAPVHTRTWTIDPEKVSIKDQVMGGVASAVSRIIFHADVIIDKKDERTFTLVTPNDANLTLKVVSGISALVTWENTNEFGCLNDTYGLEISLVDGRCLVEIF